MPINSNNHKIGDLYAGIYKKKQDQLNESVKKQHVVSESLKSAYLPSTPFHKYLTDYDQMYNNYRSTVILKESFNNDINTAMHLMYKNPELCNEIFGAIGQKIKQGVQAGAQAVQQKLIAPIINMIISKLPKDKQEALAKASEGGPQALQQFIQKEGDPNIANQVASEGAPVAESTDHQLLHAYHILSMLMVDSSGVLKEDAAQNKFKNFQKTLNQIAGEIQDPAVKQQAQVLAQYVATNYTQRGTPKGAASQGKQGAAPAKPTPGAPKAGGAGPLAPAGGAGPLAPAGGQGGPLAPTGPAREINVTPAGPQSAPTTQTGSTASAAPTAAGGGSSLIGKIGSFIKNNPKLSAAAALGLIGAIGVATGGIGFIAPMVTAGLKAGGIGAAVGAVKGAMGAKEGERLKGALKGAASGAATGGLIGAAGGLAGQAFGAMGGGAPVDQGSEVNPNAQSPESLGTPEADTGSEVNPNAQSPESLGGGGYEEPTGQEEVSPTQGTEEAGAAEMAGAGQSSEGTGDTEEYTSAQGQEPQSAPAAKPAAGTTTGQQQVQAQKAAANLQPGEVLKKDSLGRTFRVKAK